MLSAAGRMQYGISMSSRTGLAGVISLMILGCATPVGTTDTTQWSQQSKRQDAHARAIESGRPYMHLGGVGHVGPRPPQVSQWGDISVPR
jgi:hypothetical protein